MIPMSIKQVATALGADCAAEHESRMVRGVTIDSRRVTPGDLFVAIRGERFDGHRFIAQAVADGAVACVCGRDATGPPAETAAVNFIVDDTVEALGCLAKYYRHEIMPPSTAVVAVTGSNGKTTTKRMIHHVLGAWLEGRSAPKSFNNKIGVPLTLLSSEPEDRYLIAEIGTNATGEVASLAAMVSPDVAVITSVGEAHLEGLGDVNAVAAEKASLLDHLRPDAFALVNTDRPEMQAHIPRDLSNRLMTFGFDARAELRVTRVRGTLRGTTFELGSRYTVELPLPGPHHATNAAAAFAVSRWFGLAPADIVKRLSSFKPVEGRSGLIQIGDVMLVDDTYNANPASMAAAIEGLRLGDGRRRVFVMGDMYELGPQSASLHQRIVRLIHRAGIDVLVAVGEATVAATRVVTGRPGGTEIIHCEDADAACQTLMGVLSPGDTVWIKGSHAMQLDRVVSHLTAHYPPLVNRAAVA